MRHRVLRVVPSALLCGLFLVTAGGTASADNSSAPRILRADAGHSPQMLVDVGMPAGATTGPRKPALSQDGVPQKVTVRQLSPTALRVVFVVDTASTPKDIQQSMHNAVSDLATTLTPGAKAGLVVAGGEARVAASLTDANTLLDALGDTWNDPTPSDSADMSMALELARQQLDASGPGRRAIVVASYGQDSGELSSDLADKMRADGILVYDVPLPGADPDADLTSLAESSGGLVSLPPTAASPTPSPRGAPKTVPRADDVIVDAFTAVGDDLANQYEFSYVSTAPKKPGQQVELTVSLDNSTKKSTLDTSVRQEATLVGSLPTETAAAAAPSAARAGGSSATGYVAGGAVLAVVLVTALVGLVGMRRRGSPAPAEGPTPVDVDVIGNGAGRVRTPAASVEAVSRRGTTDDDAWRRPEAARRPAAPERAPADAGRNRTDERARADAGRNPAAERAAADAAGKPAAERARADTARGPADERAPAEAARNRADVRAPAEAGRPAAAAPPERPVAARPDRATAGGTSDRAVSGSGGPPAAGPTSDRAVSDPSGRPARPAEPAPVAEHAPASAPDEPVRPAAAREVDVPTVTDRREPAREPAASEEPAAARTDEGASRAAAAVGAEAGAPAAWAPQPLGEDRGVGGPAERAGEDELHEGAGPEEQPMASRSVGAALGRAAAARDDAAQGRGGREPRQRPAPPRQRSLDDAARAAIRAAGGWSQDVEDPAEQIAPPEEDAPTPSGEAPEPAAPPRPAPARAKESDDSALGRVFGKLRPGRSQAPSGYVPKYARNPGSPAPKAAPPKATPPAATPRTAGAPASQKPPAPQAAPPKTSPPKPPAPPEAAPPKAAPKAAPPKAAPPKAAPPTRGTFEPKREETPPRGTFEPRRSGPKRPEEPAAPTTRDSRDRRR